jgi:hypothetical protein
MNEQKRGQVTPRVKCTEPPHFTPSTSKGLPCCDDDDDGTMRGWISSATLLLGLCVQLAWSARLAKPGSTHPSFPMDAFAKPTFQLIFEDSNPISNRTALDLLQNYSQGPMSHTSDTGMSEYQASGSESENETDKSPLQVYLHRTSASMLHLCSIPRSKAKPKATLHLNESSLKDHRSRIVENALKLLSPLKDSCLFYTMDWFTYSLCYGDAIKQFRALPRTVGGPTTPAMDPLQDSYVLGRWNDQIEGVKAGEPSTDLQTHETGSPARGTELMELVHFSSLGSANGEPEGKGDDSQIRLEANVEGKGRYISQIWTDGTRCIINNELRTTEVQFHCAKSPPRDRITVIKEITTCNYIVVVDTPRLCEEPALAQVEDEVREVKCQPILSDEEMAKRQGASATIDGEEEPSKVIVNEEKTSEAASATKRGREGVKASIESIVSQINSAGGASAAELGVIIGWDEEGKFMIAPKEQEPEPLKEDQSATNSEVEQTEAAIKAKEKWDLLLEKLIHLEDEIFDAAEVEIYLANTQDSAEVSTTSIDEQKETQAASKEQDKTPLDKPATETKAETTPVRTNQLPREKESLGQRAERFYKQQEAIKQQEEEAAARKHDEEGRLARDRDEL